MKSSKIRNYYIAITNMIFIFAVYSIEIIYRKLGINLLSQNNMYLIKQIVCLVIGSINIICGIINRKSRTIAFWQIAFGISEIMFEIDVIDLYEILFVHNYDYGRLFVFEYLPIIIVIICIIKAIKNKKIMPIQILGYIGVILICILEICNIIKLYWNIWGIIAVIMQLVENYRHKILKEQNKIVNIVLFYILQSIVIFGFIVLIIYSFIQVKYREYITEKINEEIIQLDGSTNKELYTLVKRNGKYGYINEKGDERILCQYDIASIFLDVRIDKNNYYVAFAKLNNDDYLITKDNHKLNINQYIKGNSYNTDNMTNPLQYTTVLMHLLKIKVTQTASMRDQYRYLELLSIENGTMYNFENYTITFEKIEGETSKTKNTYVHMLNHNEIYEIDTYKTKLKVTVRKNNGEEKSNIENIVGYFYDERLPAFSDNYIEFESLDGKNHGFYDKNGNKYTLNNNYTIINVKNGNVLIRKKTESENQDTIFYVLDENKKMLLKAKKIDVIGEHLYVVRDMEDHLTLYDSNLQIISNNYEDIFLSLY